MADWRMRQDWRGCQEGVHRRLNQQAEDIRSGRKEGTYRRRLNRGDEVVEDDLDLFGGWYIAGEHEEDGVAVSLELWVVLQLGHADDLGPSRMEVSGGESWYGM